MSAVALSEVDPSRDKGDIGRRHRWIRGDWQITQWLLPRVPGSDARRTENPLSHLSQWKIFDNLRRSLVPLALLTLVVGSWLTAGLAAIMTALVLAIIALPALLGILTSVLRKSDDLPWSMHLREVARLGWRQAGQILLTLVFLPYDAFVSLDAIGRTLMRVMVIANRRLLEWQTSSDTERVRRARISPAFFAAMWITPVLSAVTGFLLLVALRSPAQLPVALPLLALWLIAPAVAWWVSQSFEQPAPAWTEEQRRFLHRTARKTWAFFERFVTAQENWLPPDNFQETPSPVVATRTSPTNMGLALLANVAARRISATLPTGGLLRRTRDALGAMEGLERYRGHFYNWYDTRTRAPLQPLYVSSVDSGNLSGHLLTLGAGLRETADEKVFTPKVWAGLRDTWEILAALLPRESAVQELADGTRARLRSPCGQLT